MATTVQQADSPSQAAVSFPAKAVYWLIAFVVIIGLALAFSMMKQTSLVPTPTENYRVPPK